MIVGKIYLEELIEDVLIKRDIKIEEMIEIEEIEEMIEIKEEVRKDVKDQKEEDNSDQGNLRYVPTP